jgi:hypothetical protein
MQLKLYRSLTCLIQRRHWNPVGCSLADDGLAAGQLAKSNAGWCALVVATQAAPHSTSRTWPEAATLKTTRSSSVLHYKNLALMLLQSRQFPPQSAPCVSPASLFAQSSFRLTTLPASWKPFHLESAVILQHQAPAGRCSQLRQYSLSTAKPLIVQLACGETLLLSCLLLRAAMSDCCGGAFQS